MEIKEQRIADLLRNYQNYWKIIFL